MPFSSHNLSSLKAFPSPWKETPDPLSSHSPSQPPISSWPPPFSFLPLWVCLFWTFHVRVVDYDLELVQFFHLFIKKKYTEHLHIPGTILVTEEKPLPSWGFVTSIKIGRGECKKIQKIYIQTDVLLGIEIQCILSVRKALIDSRCSCQILLDFHQPLTCYSFQSQGEDSIFYKTKD